MGSEDRVGFAPSLSCCYACCPSIERLADTSSKQSEDGPAGLPDCGDSIDPLTFEQILEMDDDDDREFSKSIVTGFFEQAEQTFTQMDDSV